MAVTIVCGPPGSGKTTYVNERKRWGDLVVDVDAILSAISGQPWYEKPDGLLPLAFDLRDYIYRQIQARAIDALHAWVITSESDGAKRTELARKLNASVIIFEVSPDECLRRISNDKRRATLWQEWEPIVRRWWNEYTPADGEQRMYGQAGK